MRKIGLHAPSSSAENTVEKPPQRSRGRVGSGNKGKTSEPRPGGSREQEWGHEEAQEPPGDSEGGPRKAGAAALLVQGRRLGAVEAMEKPRVLWKQREAEGGSAGRQNTREEGTWDLREGRRQDHLPDPPRAGEGHPPDASPPNSSRGWRTPQIKEFQRPNPAPSPLPLTQRKARRLRPDKRQLEAVAQHACALSVLLPRLHPSEGRVSGGKRPAPRLMPTLCLRTEEMGLVSFNCACANRPALPRTSESSIWSSLPLMRKFAKSASVKSDPRHVYTEVDSTVFSGASCLG